MKATRKMLLDRLPATLASPALRQIRELVQEREAEIDSSAPPQFAHEVLSIWSIRLWNATLQGRRFVGLADLVRRLMDIPAEGKIAQISLTNGPKVGLVFFSGDSPDPVGAVISVRTSIDAQRSRHNLKTAENLHFPSSVSRSLAR